MKPKTSPYGFTKAMLNYFTVAMLTVILIPYNCFSQVIRNYIQYNNVKNYAIEERPGTSGNEFVMAGTIFDNAIPVNPRAAQGKGIHFIRVGALGKMALTGTPTYSVSRRYDFSKYDDVRCVDIVPYTNSESIIIANVRWVQDPNNFLANKDMILVIVVDNTTGSIVSVKEVSYPTLDWGYDNTYATHAIYHHDNGNGNDYLYICGYDGIQTQFPYYPEFTPHNGPSCFDKRILVIKYDVANMNTVCAHTWDYPWPTCSIDEQYPAIYDFDMAMRLIPIDDGSGDIYVTGSTNSDYSYDTRPPFPVSIPSYGSGTLSLRIDESNTNCMATVAIRPFIEHPFWPGSAQYLDNYEQGYGMFDDNPGSAGGGLYVFSNQFGPYSPGYGMDNSGPRIRMTYIDKATLNFNPYPAMHRLAWNPIDYDWGTQVLPSPNGSNLLYLAGLQSGWHQANCGNPPGSSLTPTYQNVNPFLAELQPNWNAGTQTVGLTSINFWKTYFTLNGTNYFYQLGGGLSNAVWATEFVATNVLTTGPVFTSPGWNPTVGAGAGGLNHKFTRTDANGDLPITSTQCDNAYMDCKPTGMYNIDITDAWFFNTYTEDYPNVVANNTPYTDNLFGIGYDPYCDEGGFTPMYKSSEVGVINETKNLEFEIYPNPAKDYVTVHINGNTKGDENINIKVVNMMGQIVADLFKGNISKFRVSNKLHIGNIAPGMYLIKVYYNEKLSHTEKLSIQ